MHSNSKKNTQKIPGNRQITVLKSGEFINAQILLLQPGQQLPPLRKMMKMSGLGRVVLSHALENAEKNGRIRSIPRKGFFAVAPLDGMAREVIGVLLIDGQKSTRQIGVVKDLSYIHEVIVRLNELARQENRTLEVCRAASEDLKDCKNALSAHGVKRFFFLNPSDRRLLERLVEEGFTPVAVSGNSIPGIFAAQPPHFGQVERAMKYLLEHNHRHIALIYKEHQAYRYLYEYYRELALNGIRAYLHHLLEYKIEERESLNFKTLFAVRPYPTAIICPSVWIPALYEFLNKKSLLVGKDISVISRGGEVDIHPRPTLLVNDPVRLAEVAWHLMQELLSCRLPREVQVPPELISGNSVCTLPVDRE